MADKFALERKQHLDTIFNFVRPPGLPETCSDADLLKSVKESLLGATDEEISHTLGVPANAVRHWIFSREWMAIKQHLLPQIKGVYHAKLCNLKSNVLTKLEERIRLGDPMYNNLGEPVLDDDGNPLYRPLKGKDLSGVLVQVDQVLHNLELEIGVVERDKGEVALDDLAEALEELARKKRPADISGQSQRLA